MKLIELFGYLDVEKLVPKNVEKYYKTTATPIADPETYVGLELEIENVPEGLSNMGGLFSIVADGSLRNNGKEAVTLPMRAKYVENLLTTFFRKHAITQDANYSDRCSVHIHVNAQQFTVDQVRAITLTYQTVERLLFTFIGEDRENNIYCVPWYQAGFATGAMEKLLADPNANLRTWQKYTSLNLLPLRERGTFEFRHLRGTCDVNEIINWLNLCLSIVKFGRDNAYADVSKIIMEMNTVSNYEQFIHSVFGQWTHLLTNSPNYQALLATGVVDSKLMLRTSKSKKYKSTLPPDIAELLRATPVPERRPIQLDIEGAERRIQEYTARVRRRAPAAEQPQMPDWLATPATEIVVVNEESDF